MPSRGPVTGTETLPTEEALGSLLAHALFLIDIPRHGSQTCECAVRTDIYALATNEADLLFAVPQTVQCEACGESVLFACVQHPGSIDACPRIPRFLEHRCGFGIRPRVREAGQDVQHAALHVALVGLWSIPS